MSGQLTRRELELVEDLVEAELDVPAAPPDRRAVSRVLSFGLACDVEHQAGAVKAALRVGDVDAARQRLAVLVEAAAALHAELSGVAVVRATPSQWSVNCRRCGVPTTLEPGLGACRSCGAELWTIGSTSGPHPVQLAPGAPKAGR